MCGRYSLNFEEFDDWLTPEHSTQYLFDMINAYPDNAMAKHIFSKEVGNIRNNHPGLLEKADLF